MQVRIVRTFSTYLKQPVEWFDLGNGHKVIALEDGMEIALPAGVESRRGSRLSLGYGGDMFWVSNLPPVMGPVYRGAFGRRGIELEVPGEADRRMIHRVIFDELCLGIFRDESRAAYVRVVQELAARGCDAVALVCTEIPLLITPEVSPLPTLDSTRMLAVAAVEVALGERPLPQWRGGPVE